MKGMWRRSTLNGALAFLLFFGIKQSYAQDTGTVHFPIVQGEPATAEQIFGTVGILNVDYGQVDCTGTLISPKLVLTAAHCVLTMNMDYSFGPPIDRASIQVVAGTLTPDQNHQGHSYTVAQILAHEEFPSGHLGVDATGLGQQDDIALLVLDHAVTEIKPIPLATVTQLDNAMAESNRLTIAGYGIYDLYTEASGVLHIAEVDYQKRTDWEFFAGTWADKDACMGDSGGPVYLFSDGQAFVVGITSRGRMDSNNPCGDGGIYTLAPAYLDWIDRTAKDQWEPTEIEESVAEPGSRPEQPDPEEEPEPQAQTPESTPEKIEPRPNNETPPAPQEAEPGQSAELIGESHSGGCSQSPGEAPLAMVIFVGILLWFQRRGDADWTNARLG